MAYAPRSGAAENRPRATVLYDETLTDQLAKYDRKVAVSAQIAA
jgi:hypothetical protein